MRRSELRHGISPSRGGGKAASKGTSQRQDLTCHMCHERTLLCHSDLGRRRSLRAPSAAAHTNASVRVLGHVTATE